LHSDASQAACVVDLHISKLGVDLLTLNGGKAYGPKMSGALYVRSGIIMHPIVSGGGQEKGLRSGTESLAQIAGFVTAMEQAQQGRKAEAARLSLLHALARKQAEQIKHEIVVFTPKKSFAPHIFSFAVPGIDGERVVMMLDEAGYECATGSACSALSDQSSHVVKAMGFDEATAQGSLRISFGRATSDNDVNGFFAALSRILSSPHAWLNPSRDEQ
jgi:cysteine desulfurase